MYLRDIQLTMCLFALTRMPCRFEHPAGTHSDACGGPFAKDNSFQAWCRWWVHGSSTSLCKTCRPVLNFGHQGVS
eukprot:c12623_g2_i1 orf=336-560(-)